MEKKASSASSKLRSLKEFLSSTRSLNHQNYDNVGLKKTQHASSNNFRSSIRNTKNSLSLFNLIATNGGAGSERLSGPYNNGEMERPISMALDDQYGYAYEDREIGPRLLPNKSVSMYGLSPVDSCSSSDGSNLHPTTSTRNLAARLFYNLRSKFRRRRRDRSKIVDSKSTDFGALFPEDSKSSRPSLSLPVSNDADSSTMKPSSARYKLRSANSLDTILDSSSFNNDGAIVNDMTETETVNEVGETSSTAGTSGTSKSNNYNDIGVTLQLLAETVESSSRSSVDGRASVRRVLSQEEIRESTMNQTPSPRPAKCLTKELEDLLHYGWYWGSLSKDEAEAKLKDQPDGAFVVRDSSSDHYLLSLSFNSNSKTLHTRIEYRNGQFCFYMSPDADSFSTVAELIQHCIAYSEVGIFCYSKPRRSHNPSTSYPVRLTKPISRFTEVKSLLYLSRLKIRQYVRFDLIPSLPLPSSLIEFVSEQRYI